MITKKHIESGLYCRMDGAVWIPKARNGRGGRWTYGDETTNSGYLSVRYKKKHYTIHRIIARCFVPNPDNKPTVDHISRDKLDNNASGLRWATHREQRDNSGVVLNARDYGVRWCDNKKAYMHAYYLAHPEKFGRKPA